MTSLEQNRKVHLARRLMKLFAPDFRIVAQSDLPAGGNALDLARKTIEVSEKSSLEEALAAIVFQIGHLRLRQQGLYSIHFGNFESTDLLEDLVKEGADADRYSGEWATRQLVEIFNFSDSVASRLVSDLTWDEIAWRNYYLS